jgi:hypothetical protein
LFLQGSVGILNTKANDRVDRIVYIWCCIS